MAPEVWDAWTPSAVAFPSERYVPVDERVIREAMRRAPAAAERCLRQLLAHGSTRGIANLRCCWTEALGQLVVEQLPNQPVTARLRMANLLVALNHPGYAAVLAADLQSWLAGDWRMFAWYVGVAAILLGNGGETAWPLFKAALEAPRGRPGRICQYLAGNGPWPALPGGLRESTLAQLYAVMSAHLPPERDPRPEPWISRQGPGHVMAGFRRSLLDGLARRGGPDAIEALQGLAVVLPSQRTLLAEALDRAEERYRWTSWQAPAVRDVVEALQQPTRRTLTTAEQLTTVILETLAQIQEDLRGSWVPVKTLWNNRPVQPVPENEFSDFIAYLLHKELAAAGVIVNREVAIRPGRGGAAARQAGERVDLLVQTWPKGTERTDVNTLTVIIEVKGCWHPQIRTAMQEQLVDSYLYENNHCRHGIYLVGWFICDAWAGRWDRRKTRAQRNWADIDMARADLQKQANELSRADVKVAPFVMDVRLTSSGRAQRRYRSGERAIAGVSQR